MSHLYLFCDDHLPYTFHPDCLPCQQSSQELYPTQSPSATHAQTPATSPASTQVFTPSDTAYMRTSEAYSPTFNHTLLNYANSTSTSVTEAQSLLFQLPSQPLPDPPPVPLQYTEPTVIASDGDAPLYYPGQIASTLVPNQPFQHLAPNAPQPLPLVAGATHDGISNPCANPSSQYTGHSISMAGTFHALLYHQEPIVPPTVPTQPLQLPVFSSSQQSVPLVTNATHDDIPEPSINPSSQHIQPLIPIVDTSPPLLHHQEPSVPPVDPTQPLLPYVPNSSQQSASLVPNATRDGPPDPRRNPEEFIEWMAPQDLRSDLRQVLESPWFTSNRLQGCQELEKFIFKGQDSKWKCAMMPCASSLSCWPKKQRAVDHIRNHIDHRPFSCNGGCGRSNCLLAFCAKRDLASHTTPILVKCDLCGRTVRRCNIYRHHKSKICKQTRSYNDCN